LYSASRLIALHENSDSSKSFTYRPLDGGFQIVQQVGLTCCF